MKIASFQPTFLPYPGYFGLIDYVDNLSDLSDNFWEGKLKTDIIHFITRIKLKNIFNKTIF